MPPVSDDVVILPQPVCILEWTVAQKGRYHPKNRGSRTMDRCVSREMRHSIIYGSSTNNILISSLQMMIVWRAQLIRAGQEDQVRENTKSEVG